MRSQSIFHNNWHNWYFNIQFSIPWFFKPRKLIHPAYILVYHVVRMQRCSVLVQWVVCEKCSKVGGYIRKQKRVFSINRSNVESRLLLLLLSLSKAFVSALPNDVTWKLCFQGRCCCVIDLLQLVEIVDRSQIINKYILHLKKT